jgi:hypothetical protein
MYDSHDEMGTGGVNLDSADVEALTRPKMKKKSKKEKREKQARREKRAREESEIGGGSFAEELAAAATGAQEGIEEPVFDDHDDDVAMANAGQEGGEATKRSRAEVLDSDDE